ncbi:MAG: insulinase family protein, partial [Planctomycetales bacterium]|nr:insulinase family protein [Planctomycetales bacterium]
FFMGTERRVRRQIRDEVMDRGGDSNALTDFDRTEYWSVVRREDFELALDGLADGARNVRVDPKEVEMERTVMLDELSKRFDNPAVFSRDELEWLCWHPHPYAHGRAGRPEEIRRLTRDDLMRIYRKHFRPDRFVLIVTGDVSAPAAIEAVRRHFGDFRAEGPPPARPPSVAPARGFERKFFARDLAQAYVTVAAPAPGMIHPDQPAMDMTAEFLRARLYTSLVLEKKIANSLNGGVENYTDLGIFNFTATPTSPDLAPEVERVMLHQIAEVGKIPTGRRDWDEEAELSRYQRNCQLGLAFDREDARARANLLAWGGAMGTLEHLASYPDRIGRVTLSDIGRCTRTYLAAPCLNAVVIGPEAARGSPADDERREELLRVLEGPGEPAVDWTARADPSGTEGWEEFRLGNGARVLVGTDRDFGLVTLAVFTAGGYASDPLGLEGRAWLTNDMLLIGAEAGPRVDGTPGTAWDRNRFSNVINRLGGRFQKGIAKEYAYHQITVARPDLEEALDMFGAAYLRPTFPAPEVEVEKEQGYGVLRWESDDLPSFAFRQAKQRIYGDHPYARSEYGTMESLRGLGRGDLEEARLANFRPEDAVVVLYGDLSVREARDLARAAFGAWPRRERASPPAPLEGGFPISPQPSGRHEVALDKEQAFVILGCQAPPYQSEHYPAASFAATTISFRAFRELIYERKLSYNASCSLDASRQGGACFFYVECKPEQVVEAEAALRQYIRDLAGGPIPADEFERVRSNILGKHPLERQRGSARAREAGAHAVFGLPPDFSEHYRRAIAALTPQQVHASVRTWLDPERMTLVVVRRAAARGESR